MPNQRRHDRGNRTLGFAAFAILAALLLAIIPALTAWTGGAVLAQDDEEAVDPGQALLRVFHASPDAGPVDVLIDDQPVLTGIEFGTVSDYLPVPDGETNVKVVPAGGTADDAVIDDGLDLEDGVPYIFAAAGMGDDLDGQLYTVDRNRIEDPNAARVRVIHLSPDAGGVDVFVAGGDALFEDVDFTDASDYTEIAAGTYDLEVRSTDEEGAVTLESPGVTFDAGLVYDVLAIGQAADNSLQLLNTSTETLKSCAEVLGLEGTNEDACVRVVHASPDAPNVDVYVDEDGQPVVADLGFGGATPDWIVVPSGQHEFDVVPTSEPVDSSVADGEFELEAGTAYDIVALNLLDDLEVSSYELDLTALPEGQSRLRAIHAAPDLGEVDIAVEGGPLLFQDLEFTDASDVLEIEPGPVTLELRDGDDNVVLTEPDLNFEDGTIYHVYAIGRAEDQSLGLLVLPAPPAEGPSGPAATTIPATPGPEPVATPDDDEDAVEEAVEEAEDVVDETPEG